MSDSVKNTPSQSIEIVDPEGSCKKDNHESVCKHIHCAYCHLDNCCTCEECKYEEMDPGGSCKKDNSKPVHRFGGLRMNKKLKELARVLIENGQNWLCFVSAEDEDVILHLEDYFYEEGYKFTIHEVNFVCYEMKKRMGVF